MFTSRRTILQAALGLTAAPVVFGGSSWAESIMTGGGPRLGNAYAVMLADERLTTWVRLIDAAGLAKHARDASSYTVFAPSDSAFEAVPELVKTLLGDAGNTGPHVMPGTWGDPSNVVQYIRSHVVSGKHDPRESAGKRQEFTSLTGSPVIIDGAQKPIAVQWRNPLDGKMRQGRLSGEPIVCINAVVCVVDHVETV